jgi:hypothetical protein
MLPWAIPVAAWGLIATSYLELPDSEVCDRCHNWLFFITSLSFGTPSSRLDPAELRTSAPANLRSTPDEPHMSHCHIITYEPSWTEAMAQIPGLTGCTPPRLELLVRRPLKPNIFIVLNRYDLRLSGIP